MKKYGLQLRVPPSQQKRQPIRPTIPPPGFHDDDEDDVEKEIARHAAKNKSLKDIEEQHKKALEEDPSIFDYDGVYDSMKEKIARPVAQDRQERKPKYIHTLIEKAKERERVHEIVYEKKLVKERSKEDHLYAGKDKFVTSAYKKKLAEQAKWLEEERLRELREEKEDVTKKSDISDFYFNLSKNVAFGGGKTAESKEAEKQEENTSGYTAEKDDLTMPKPPSINDKEAEQDQVDTSSLSEKRLEPLDGKPGPDDTSPQDNIAAEKPLSDQANQDHHKRTEDALAAAKERFLARKKVKLQ
ncbi:nuclear speckle splicing regulatory protein 1-like [Macadamia integrifolia]|uniref:nuclear speckle splicing regulatory protein 1-like n=1 Tax=Macadamia integrifolia TaxID=60698 RepID=UPI001C52B538|nr:nuclear speckle splicing regulatory protein 1-like [Macadamia integrifolia]